MRVFSLIVLFCLTEQAICLAPPPPGGLDKGFNILGTASKILPQGRIVKTAKESWKFIWKRMMAELAPQSKSGTYERPSYASNGVIGSSQFPDEGGRYHLYLGNPCPWCHRAKLAVALKKLKVENIGVTTLVDDPGKFKVHVYNLFCYPPRPRTAPAHLCPLFIIYSRY